MSGKSDQARHNDATAAGMRRSARQRQCPSCKRRGAVRRQVTPDEVVVRSCRWCGWSEEHPLSEAEALDAATQRARAKVHRRSEAGS